MDPVVEHRAHPTWRGWTIRTKARTARLIFESAPRAAIMGLPRPRRAATQHEATRVAVRS